MNMTLSLLGADDEDEAFRSKDLAKAKTGSSSIIPR